MLESGTEGRGRYGGKVMSSVKDAMLGLVRSLKDDCTWDEVAERFDLVRRIDLGLADADAGRVTPHEEFFRRLDEEDADLLDGSGEGGPSRDPRDDRA